jgi:hypothetical protein
MRKALLFVSALLLAVVTVQAEDKEVKLEGTVCCAKCELKQGDSCNAVLVVKEGEKEHVYYFDTASQEKFGKDCCKEKKAGTVTGTTAEKDGKKWITVSKVEFKKD